MSDEIIGVIQTLYYHREIIRNCCLTHHGELSDTVENSAAIRALKKHHLAWQMGGSESITLTRPLLNLLASAQHNRRRRLAAANVDILWEHIQERVGDYSDAMSRGKSDDLDQIQMEIKDGLYELANDINTSTGAFSDYIDHGYAYTKDLLLRVKENERAIDKAKQLNASLQGLEVHILVNGSRLNAEIRKLFLHNFLNAINESRAELVNTLHRLSELLVKLRSDNELGKLIRTFEVKFKGDPDFLAESPPYIESVPNAINFSKPFIRPRKGKNTDTKPSVLPGDIYNPELESSLGTIARSIRKTEIQLEQNLNHTPQPIIDSRGEIAEIEPEHPVIMKARCLTLAIKNSNQEHSLVKIMKKLDVDCSSSLWLSTVINAIYSLPDNIRPNYQLTFIEYQSPIYSGNHFVSDIRVRYVKSTSY